MFCVYSERGGKNVIRCSKNLIITLFGSIPPRRAVRDAARSVGCLALSLNTSDLHLREPSSLYNQHYPAVSRNGIIRIGKGDSDPALPAPFLIREGKVSKSGPFPFGQVRNPRWPPAREPNRRGFPPLLCQGRRNRAVRNLHMYGFSSPSFALEMQGQNKSDNCSYGLSNVSGLYEHIR